MAGEEGFNIIVGKKSVKTEGSEGAYIVSGGQVGTKPSFNYGGSASGGGGDTQTTTSSSSSVVDTTKPVDSTPQPQPKQVSLPDKNPSFLSLGTAARVSGGRFLDYIGSKFDRPGSQNIAYEEVFSPFESSGTPKSEQVAYSYIPSGTISPNESPVRDVTFGDIQRERVTQRNIQLGEATKGARNELDSYYGELQTGIDTGNIDYTTAVAMGEAKQQEIQTQIDVKANEIYKANPDVEGIRTLSGSKVKRGAEIAGDLLVYSNPLTSSAGVASSVKKDPIVIDSKDNIALYPDYKPSAETVVGSLVVAGYGAGLLRKGGKAVVAGEIEEAIAQQTLTKGTRIKGNNFVLDEGIARGSSGEAFARSEITNLGFGEGNKAYSLGYTDTVVTTKSYFAGNPIVVGGRTGIKTESVLFPETKSVIPSVSKVETIPKFNYEGIATKKGINLKGNYRTDGIVDTTQFYGGLSSERGGFALGTGGRVRNFVLGTDPIKEPKLYLDFQTEQSSILKIISPGKRTDNIVSFGGGGSKTSLSKTFSKPQVLDPVLKQSQESFVKTITPPRTKPASGLNPLSFSKQETSLTQQSRQIVSQKPLSPRQQNNQLLIPEQEFFNKQKENQLLNFKDTTSSKTNQRNILGQFGGTAQDFSPVYRSGSKQLQTPALTSLTARPFAPNIPRTTRQPFKGFTPFAGLPPFPNIGGGSFGKGFFTGKRQLTRTPSFAAATLGITSSKPGKLEFTGLFERPIISSKKRKKKRKK